MKKILLLFSFLLIISCSKDETIKEETPEIFTLFTSVSPSNGGSITGMEQTYKSGDQVTLTAEPSENFEFKEWQGDFTGSENPLKFAISSDKEVVAIFEEKVYSLEFDIVGKWYIRNSSTNQSSTANKSSNKQSDNGNCSVTSIEFREDGTYILITSEGELSGQYVIIGNKSIDLGNGKIENLAFINDVLDFTLTLNSGCSSNISAQLLTYVPDDAFEKELIRLGLDNTLDNFVETVNVRGVKILHLEPSPQIIDFTGLEDFESLEDFKVWVVDYDNSLQNPSGFEIDFTSNSNLRYLDLYGVGIEKLNLQHNHLLEELHLYYTSLTGTISFPNNPLLREVYINQNYQTPIVNNNLDFTHNPNLEIFSSDVTYIGQLDISNSHKLKVINVTESVQEIVTSGVYENLTTLIATGSLYNHKIDFSQFPNLEGLMFEPNLDSFDISNNGKLKVLRLYEAPNLKSLDLSKNSVLSTLYISAERTPSLSCIKVNGDQLSKLDTEELDWVSGFNYSLECE